MCTPALSLAGLAGVTIAKSLVMIATFLLLFDSCLKLCNSPLE
jgi:hypothetical protein